MELMYSRYSGMLYGYILQFVPDRAEAEELLVHIFCELAPRLGQACESNLSVFCWLQVESRKIILDYLREHEKKDSINKESLPLSFNTKNANYYSLLQDASAEHQWVFRELYLNGKQKEDLAGQVGKDLAYISMLLRESLLIIRKKLG